MSAGIRGFETNTGLITRKFDPETKIQGEKRAKRARALLRGNDAEPYASF